VGLEAAILERNRNRSLVYGLRRPKLYRAENVRGSSYLPKERAVLPRKGQRRGNGTFRINKGLTKVRLEKSEVRMLT